MKELTVYATKTRAGKILVNMADYIPDELAQVVGAVLSTDTTMLEESLYEVMTVTIGDGLFPHPMDMGEYLNWEKGGEILIDINRVCEAAVLQDFPAMDITMFAFHGFLQTISHEAIHARNAGMYPEHYGFTNKRYSPEDYDKFHKATEEKAKELSDHLMYRALDLFDITVDKQGLGFLEIPIRQAIHKHGMDHVSNYFYDKVVFADNYGGKVTSWRDFLGRTGLATGEVENLLPLPNFVVEEEKVMEVSGEAAETNTEERISVPSFIDYMERQENDQDFDTSVLEDDDVEQPVYTEPEVVQQTPTVQPEPKVGNAVSAEELAEMFKTVIMRCYQHIYTKCGYDGHGNFKNPGGVLEPVYIGDVQNKELIAENHSVDEHGRFRVYKNPTDFIKGIVASKTGLPMFHLVFLVGNQRVVRRLVPQNPNKKDTAGNLKWTADAVQNKGEMLAWVLDPEASEGKSKFTHKINNNRLTKLGEKK